MISNHSVAQSKKILKILYNQKKRRTEHYQLLTEEGYEPLDKKFDRIDWRSPSKENCFLIFKRMAVPSFLKIFIKS